MSRPTRAGDAWQSACAMLPGVVCLFALLSVFFPRLGLLCVWIFTNEVDQAFDGFILPLLGLIFLPLTTLVYALLWGPFGGVEGIEWFWVVLAFLFDIGALGGGARARD